MLTSNDWIYCGIFYTSWKFCSDIVSRIIEYKATLKIDLFTEWIELALVGLIAMTTPEVPLTQMDFTFLSLAIIAVRAIKSFVVTIK